MILLAGIIVAVVSIWVEDNFLPTGRKGEATRERGA